MIKKQKFCDLCDREIGINFYATEEKVIDYEVFTGEIKWVWKWEAGDTSYTELDICSDCIDVLRKFINERFKKELPPQTGG